MKNTRKPLTSAEESDHARNNWRGRGAKEEKEGREETPLHYTCDSASVACNRKNNLKEAKKVPKEEKKRKNILRRGLECGARINFLFLSF